MSTPTDNSTLGITKLFSWLKDEAALGWHN